LLCYRSLVWCTGVFNNVWSCNAAGKNLTEKLVAAAHCGGLPTAIVRPGLVCGLSGQPYPGYCGNLAGEKRMHVLFALLQRSFDRYRAAQPCVWPLWAALPGLLRQSGR
jgi:nucleoside-diphosphate-sugar epimerase